MAGKNGFRSVADAGLVAVVEPELRIALRNMNDRFGEHGLAVQHQPAGMIFVKVGDEDVVDSVGRVTRRLDRSHQPAAVLAVEIAGPSIDQDQAIAHVDEKRVDHALERRLHLLVAEQFIDLPRLRAHGELRGLKRMRAVKQCGDFEPADMHPVVAGRLPADGLGGRRGQLCRHHDRHRCEGRDTQRGAEHSNQRAPVHLAALFATVATASSITAATSRGCDSSETWLDGDGQTARR
jgi:hypothetical protein